MLEIWKSACSVDISIRLHFRSVFEKLSLLQVSLRHKLRPIVSQADKQSGVTGAESTLVSLVCPLAHCHVCDSDWISTAGQLELCFEDPSDSAGYPTQPSYFAAMHYV